MEIKYNFDDVPTVRAFFLDDSYIKAIVGPFGSGKSSGCVMYLLDKAFKQEPDEKGVRRTRFAIVRNTYRMLKDTTKKTIDDWLTFAHWREGEFKYIIHVKTKDGTVVHSEWLLRALDKPEHIKNLLSLEVTGAWINEAREIGKDIFDALQGRVGRYPGNNATWYGVILDTNPPDTDHWFYKFFEEDMVDNPKVKIFHQPSGLSPEAENIRNLRPNYYQDLCIGKDEEWIKVYVHGEYGYTKEGKPVYRNFNPKTMIREVKPIKGSPIIVGIDLGLNPAAVFTQLDTRGRLYMIDEIASQDMAVTEFMESLFVPKVRTKYYNYSMILAPDPAGRQRSQVDARTVIQILRSYGFRVSIPKTNSLTHRIDAVNYFMTRSVEDKPCFIVDKHCTRLITALRGGYHYKRIAVSGERYRDVPDKNMYSHIAEALQYAALIQRGGITSLSEDTYQLGSQVRDMGAWV